MVGLNLNGPIHRLSPVIRPHPHRDQRRVAAVLGIEPSPSASRTHRFKRFFPVALLHIQDGETMCTRGVVHLAPDWCKVDGPGKVLILMMFNRRSKIG